MSGQDEEYVLDVCCTVLDTWGMSCDREGCIEPMRTVGVSFTCIEEGEVIDVMTPLCETHFFELMREIVFARRFAAVRDEDGEIHPVEEEF